MQSRLGIERVYKFGDNRGSYVIVDRAAKIAKIGASDAPNQRLRKLRFESGRVNLELVAAWPRGRGGPTEAELHDRFVAQRCIGEWYHLTGELARWVDSLQSTIDPLEGLFDEVAS